MKIIRWLLSHSLFILLIVAVIYAYMFWGNLLGKDTPAGKAVAYLSNEFVEVEEFVNAIKAKQAQLSEEKSSDQDSSRSEMAETANTSDSDKAPQQIVSIEPESIESAPIEPESIDYNVKRDSYDDICNELKSIEDSGAVKRVKHMWSELEKEGQMGYSQDDLKRFKVSDNDMSEYADWIMGKQMKDYFDENPDAKSLYFNAEL